MKLDISVNPQPMPIDWKTSSKKATAVAANAYRTRLVDALAAAGARWLISASSVLKVCGNVSILCAGVQGPRWVVPYTEVDLQGHARHELENDGYRNVLQPVSTQTHEQCLSVKSPEAQTCSY